MSAVLRFRAGGRVLCADASEISAVLRRPPLTRVPNAPAALAGVAALKGRATAVVELSELLERLAPEPAVVPAKAGTQEPDDAPRPLDPRFRGDDMKGARLLLLRGETAAVAVDKIEGLGEAAPGALRLDLSALVAASFPAPKRAVAKAAAIEAPRAKRESERGFVEVALGGQRFAFALEEVRAVARVPALTPIPGGDPVVLGLAEWGGAVIPVVELADLLGLPRRGGAHMVVTTIGGASVGLRVERLLGVLRLDEGALAPVPPLVNRGRGEARVTAVARSASGLVAVLASRQLLDGETQRRLEALAPAAGSAAPVPARGAASMLVFRVGGDRYALPVAAALSVARAPKRLARPPKAPGFIAGVVSLKGEGVAVIDWRLRMGVVARDGGALIYVRCGAGAAGWLVDAVEGLAALDGLEAAPLGGESGALFPAAGVMDAGGRPVLAIDAEAALAQTERDLAQWTSVP